MPIRWDDLSKVVKPTVGFLPSDRECSNCGGEMKQYVFKRTSKDYFRCKECKNVEEVKKSG